MRQGIAHVPTEETRQRVRYWSENGTTRERIARAMKMSETTLRKHYAEELAKGDEIFEAALEAQIGSRMMEKDCPPAILIFGAKARLGYREHSEIHLTTNDPKQMSREELLTVAASDAD